MRLFVEQRGFCNMSGLLMEQIKWVCNRGYRGWSLHRQLHSEKVIKHILINIYLCVKIGHLGYWGGLQTLPLYNI